MNENNFGEHFYDSNSNGSTHQAKGDSTAVRMPEDAAINDDFPVVDPAGAFDRPKEGLVHQENIDNNTTHEPHPDGDNTGTTVTAEPAVSPPLASGILPREVPTIPNIDTPGSLLDHNESEHFRTHWKEIQASFVDEPRAAVQDADTLVTEVIGQITNTLANEHSLLESRWKMGSNVSTEDLRAALVRYRTFFNRLVV